MYGSIRRYKTNPGSAEEMVRRVEEGFVPLMRKVPGFISYTVLRLGDDGLMSISVFEHEEAAEESNRIAGNWVPLHVGALISGLPQIMEAVVALHVAAQG